MDPAPLGVAPDGRTKKRRTLIVQVDKNGFVLLRLVQYVSMLKMSSYYAIYMTGSGHRLKCKLLWRIMGL